MIVSRSPLAASIWNLRPTPGRFASLIVDIRFSFALQKGSLPFLFKFALAELAGVELTVPLARIDGPLAAMRAYPRRFHDHKGGHRPEWIHSSSMTDYILRPRFYKDILGLKRLAQAMRGGARFCKGERKISERISAILYDGACAEFRDSLANRSGGRYAGCGGECLERIAPRI